MRAVGQGLIVFVLLLLCKVAFAATFGDLELSFLNGFSSPKFQLAGQDASNLRDRILQVIQNYEKNEPTDPDHVRDLAQSLFIDGRLQEGIWVLDQAGLVADAEWFAQKLEQSLSSATPQITGNIGKGVSRSNWGKVGNYPVVVKPADAYWKGSLDAEIWAYHLDRMLGLNLVAAAVKANINGVDYSIHPALQDVQDSGLNFRDQGYQEAYPEIFILDFLIRNTDRHYQNSLKSFYGFLVAIDNGRATALAEHQPKGVGLWNRYPKYHLSSLPKRDLLQNIANIDIDDFKRELSQFASADIVDFIGNNLKILKDDFQLHIIEQPVRPLNREVRLGQSPMTKEELAKLREEAKQLAEERRRIKIGAFMNEISNAVKEFKSLADGEERIYTKVNELKLSPNGHMLRSLIDQNTSSLTPRVINTLLEILVYLENENKIGEREVRRLSAYLLRLQPVEEINIKHFSYLMHVDQRIRDIIDREDFHKTFREFLEETPIGAANYQMLMQKIPDFKEDEIQCRFLLLAM